MKAFAIAILASILPFTAAVPLEKRVLVIQTFTNVVVQTVDVTTTVWVNPSPPSPKAQINNHMNNQHAHLHAHNNKDKMKQNPPAPAPVPAPAPAPAPAAAQPQSSPQEEAHQPPPVQQPAAPVAPVIPDTRKEAAYVPQPQPQAPAPQPQPQPQAVAPQPAAPAPQPQPQAVAPQPAAPVPAPVAQAKSKENVSTESGSTANCGQVGQPCSGDITFYDTGLGACGTTDDGVNENVFALAHGMMGTQSNGNPFCGRKAEVTLDGKTVVGKLVDKCMGCVGQDIDLSHKMFQALADEGRGRISSVSWKFID
ncbi:MAG: hypothetical protein L6R38_000761 [Xanthoria sp. 2 TBL-2021]|nr:MAG: hypothetical protein L6R38_000761 [Xanthoria sp. 2 TBL-2021]